MIWLGGMLSTFMFLCLRKPKDMPFGMKLLGSVLWPGFWVMVAYWQVVFWSNGIGSIWD